MPLTPFQQLLGQILGTTTPTIDPGGGGTGFGPPIPGAPGAHYPLPYVPPGPPILPMAPGQPYPIPGQGPPDTGFDLWRGPGGYYANPNPSFFGARTLNPLGTYSPQGQPDQGPLGNFTPNGFGMSAMPPPSAQVWGVPLLGDAMRQEWTDLLQEWVRQQQQPRF